MEGRGVHLGARGHVPLFVHRWRIWKCPMRDASNDGTLFMRCDQNLRVHPSRMAMATAVVAVWDRLR